MKTLMLTAAAAVSLLLFDAWVAIAFIGLAFLACDK